MKLRSANLIIAAVIISLLVERVRTDCPEDIPKINFMMDKYSRLNPSHNGTLHHCLFDIIIATNRGHVREDVDVVGWCSHSTIDGRIHRSQVNPIGYVRTHHELVKLLGEKSHFKQFMYTIGMEDYVPTIYSELNATFPCILKMPKGGDAGKGVKIIHGPQDLVSFKKEHGGGIDFFLEEALSGMGLNEPVAFGAAYKGELVSLRCAVHAHYVDLVAQHSEFRNNLYIRGHEMQTSRFYLTPCGLELTNVVQTIFRKAGSYTGPFCLNLKADNQLRLKILEINTRNCRSLAVDAGLFMASFVPLSLAIRQGIDEEYKQRGEQPPTPPVWYTYGGIFQHIADIEQMVLATGGGPGFWHSTPNMNISREIKDYGYDAKRFGLPKIVPIKGHHED